ncbi:radical SAM protein [Desulfomarina sp.]
MKKNLRTVGFRRGERNVFFHILTACNLSCRHCYINPEQHGANMLGKGTVEKWLKLFACRDKESNVIFLGGEPTMHPNLAHLVGFAKDLGYFVTVDSNGYLFHDFLERTTPDVLDYLSFSLDGPDREINDRIRGDGVFDVCTANIKKAVERGFAVSLIYTVSSRNIDHLHRMIPLLDQLKVRKFFIQVIGLRGKSQVKKSAQSLQVSRDQWLKSVPDVAEKIAAQGIHVTYPKVFLEKGEQFECAGNVAENFFIFPNGRVYQCPLCEDYPVHSYRIENDLLKKNKGLTEDRFFRLDIAEGCVMNKLLQPDTIEYDDTGNPLFRISCCLLKQEISG